MTKLKFPLRRVCLIFISFDEVDSKHKKLIFHLEKKPHGKTWPGVALATVGSKVKSGEADTFVLVRELVRKVGPICAANLIESFKKIGPEKHILFNDEGIIVYYIPIPTSILDAIHSSERKRVVTLTESDVAKIIETKNEWKNGLPKEMEDKVVVPPVLKKAILEAIRKFSVQRK